MAKRGGASVKGGAGIEGGAAVATTGATLSLFYIAFTLCLEYRQNYVYWHM